MIIIVGARLSRPKIAALFFFFYIFKYFFQFSRLFFGSIKCPIKFRNLPKARFSAQGGGKYTRAFAQFFQNGSGEIVRQNGDAYFD